MTYVVGGVDVGAALDEHVGAALAILDAGGYVQRRLLVRSTLDLHLYGVQRTSLYKLRPFAPYFTIICFQANITCNNTVQALD